MSYNSTLCHKMVQYFTKIVHYVILHQHQLMLFKGTGAWGRSSMDGGNDSHCYIHWDHLI